MELFERNRRTGYSQQFNFGMQRELPGGILVETTLLGSLARKLGMEGVNINQIHPSLIETVRPAGVFRQAYRPFPQFNSVGLIAATYGVSNYCAGVFKAEKRFSKGYNFLATYTWSKDIGNLDAISGDLGAAQTTSDYCNRRLDKGPDALDIEPRFTWSSVFELPGRRRLGRVLGGCMVAEYFGDMPHNQASAWCILYLRNMLALEDGPTLRLLAGMGDLELQAGEPCALVQSPTRFGRIGLKLEPLDRRKGWRLEFARGAGPTPAAVQLPAALGTRLRFAELTGASATR